MPGVKPVSLPGLKPATKDGDNSGPRLEICVSDVNSDEDIELEPEGIDPEETPSVLVKLQQAERKARTRKGLVGLIVAICVMLIACPVLLVTGVVELPKPVPNLPTSATVQFTVVPDSAQAVVKIYPKTQIPTIPICHNKKAQILYSIISKPATISSMSPCPITKMRLSRSRWQTAHPKADSK